MKPVSLRLKNFGPFTEEQVIDFAALEKSGLFLIYGNTGSGKTTLLDAICCALYCSSSNGVRFGGKGKSALEKMRCQQAKESEPTYVEFIFDSKGERYRFYREIRLNRGGKNFNEEHTCGRFNGVAYEPPEANLRMDRVSAYAEQIIGLTADQFRQVVILPQGKFEQLLTSESSDKEAILSGIFHVEKWDRIVGWIKAHVADGKKAVEEERLAIMTLLQQFDCASVAALGAAVEERKAALTALQTQGKALHETLEKLEAQQTALTRLDGQFAELDRRRQTLAALEKQLAHAGEEAALLQRAEAAAQLRPVYEAYITCRKQTAETLAKRDEAKRNAAAARSARAQIEAQLQAHAEGSDANEEKKKQAILYKEATAAYRGIDAKKRALRQAEAASAGAARAYAAAQAAYAKATAACSACSEALDAAEIRSRQLRIAYDENIGSALAKKLAPGRPCPVCGSTVHPHPAVHTGGAVSKEDVEQAEQMRETAHAAYKKAQAAVERHKAETENAGSKRQAEETAHALAKADYDNACADLIAGIDTLAALEKAIQTLETATRSYAAAGERLRADKSGADSKCGESDALLEAAEAAFADATAAAQESSAAWAAALDASVFTEEAAFRAALMDPAEIRSRQEALTTLKAKMQTAKEEAEKQAAQLAGQTRPDLAALTVQLKAQREAEKALIGEIAQCSDSVEKMQAAFRSLGAREEKNRAEAEKNDRERLFYDMLDGRNGVSLKRYVLGILLDLVTGRANDMLSSIYGGRYRLRRSDRKSGKERNFGLAFEVEDLQCGKSRSAADISGGEKFLVSLSLAIGLSDVVRAREGGIDLEAIFIDEGFGTLDKECLNDALYILQTVKQRNGMVGVISHVEELAENITARIETTKTGSGSRCEVFCE